MIVESKHGVIYADPNWSYQNFGAKLHGAAKAHYEVAETVDISKIPVAQKWAAKDCVLLLCATWPKLEDAFAVARAWGFGDYVTGIPWIKTSPNTGNIRTGIGFWFQSTSEMILVFRRGKPPAPDGSKLKKRSPVKGLLCGSEGQFYAPVKEHSAKPLLIYDWARAKLKGPYLELFARNTIHGWTCWGHETGFHLNKKGVHKYKEPKKKKGKKVLVKIKQKGMGFS